MILGGFFASIFFFPFLCFSPDAFFGSLKTQERKDSGQSWNSFLGRVGRFCKIMEFVPASSKTNFQAKLREVEMAIRRGSGRKKNKLPDRPDLPDPPERSHRRQDGAREPCAHFPDDARSTRQTPSNYLWSMTCDIWHLIYDIWHMTYDIRHTTYDIWYMIYDIWYMIYDI